MNSDVSCDLIDATGKVIYVWPDVQAVRTRQHGSGILADIELAVPLEIRIPPKSRVGFNIWGSRLMYINLDKASIDRVNNASKERYDTVWIQFTVGID